MYGKYRVRACVCRSKKLTTLQELIMYVTISHLEHVLQETNSTQTLWEYQQHL